MSKSNHIFINSMHNFSPIHAIDVGLERKKCANKRCNKYIDDEKPHTAKYCSQYCKTFVNHKCKRIYKGSIKWR